MGKRFLPGVNIQWPISEKITTGEKVIETRTYPIPPKYLNVDMILVETPGKTGKFKSRGVALIRFVDCFLYKTKKEFYADENRHKVKKGSEWAWTDKAKFGWVVEVKEVFHEPLCIKKRLGIKFTTNIELSWTSLESRLQDQGISET